LKKEREKKRQVRWGFLVGKVRFTISLKCRITLSIA
jgi:hypothetical protein